MGVDFRKARRVIGVGRRPEGMRTLLLGAVMLLSTVACAPTISRQSLKLVDHGVTFEEVLRDPDRHVGRYLLLGGLIASVRTSSEGGSELEIVQLPTEGSGRITATNRSAGRFIALDNVIRDPSLYRSERLVTLVGRVVGSKSGRIGEMDYRYPVLTVHELHLWPLEEPPDASRARFGFGIGVGFH